MHECFLLLKDEDTSVFKELYLDLLSENSKKIMRIVNKHFVVVMNNWINNFKSGGEDSPLSSKSDNANNTFSSLVDVQH